LGLSVPQAIEPATEQILPFGAVVVQQLEHGAIVAFKLHIGKKEKFPGKAGNQMKPQRLSS